MQEIERSDLHVSTHEHFVGWLWQQGYKGLCKKYAKSFGVDYKKVVHGA